MTLFTIVFTLTALYFFYVDYIKPNQEAKSNKSKRENDETRERKSLDRLFEEAPTGFTQYHNK